jgi:hypothetical protein
MPSIISNAIVQKVEMDIAEGVGRIQTNKMSNANIIKTKKLVLKETGEVLVPRPRVPEVILPVKRVAVAIPVRDIRAWCREKYGKDWFETDKDNRKKEAKIALNNA